MTGKGMKLSSFTKYLNLRVINTGVSRTVFAILSILMISAYPANAQGKDPGAANGQETTMRKSVNEVQAGKKRGELTGVPDEHFRILVEAARKQHEADSAEYQAEQSVLKAVSATAEQRERYGKKAVQDSTLAAARKAEADSLFLLLERTLDRSPEVPAPEAGEEIPAHQLSSFNVMPGQVYSQSNPVPVEPALPEGLVYTIQIAAFKNDVTPSVFRGLTPVFGRKRQGSDALYYFAGMFRRLEDARGALPEARGAGFPDAFIIALLDGAQISMERAAHLEKEWRTRSLGGTSAVPAGSGPVASSSKPAATVTKPAPTARRAAEGTRSVPDDRPAGGARPEANTQPVPIGTLSFRAEVMRIDKPVKPEVVQKIEVLAGNRGLDMVKNGSGETVFLIGNFITFESAEEYVSLLIRNGYSSARVAAYVDRQEISVEAAKELLNKLPDD